MEKNGMKKFLAALALLSLFATPLQAQIVPEPVVQWTVGFYNSGVDPVTGSPFQTQVFTKAQSQCDQPALTIPAGAVVNPTKIAADDPDHLGRQCIFGPNAAGTLTSLPAGVGMFAVATASGVTMTSVKSAASNPFNHAVTVVPAAPTNLRVVQ